MGFFKAYDMRGTFGTDFDLGLVRRIGGALPSVLAGSVPDSRRPLRILVGRDCRTTSVAVREALVAGLVAADAEVTDIGLCTTPMVYYFTAEDGYDGSVMITASHNPPSDNGLKVSKRTALPVGYADGLDEVERMVSLSITASAPASPSPSSTASAPASSSSSDWLARYLAGISARTVDCREAISRAKLRIAVDCSNGMASLFAHEMFPDAVILNDAPDGTFPCHSPNPLKAEAREQLAAEVRARGLDCGVIFDGDADRAMFVDERGEFVQPDYLIPVMARATKGSVGSSKVLHDVRTSRGAIETLCEMGCEPVMVPVGHAFAKPRMRETGAVCGGELAGHYYFGDFFGCDSGLLASLRVLGELARHRLGGGGTFSAMMAPITSRYANSGELNFRVDDKDAAIAEVLERARQLGSEISRSEMDGVRIEFADGWLNVRKSNTEPYLRLLVEAKTPEQLAAWTTALTAGPRFVRI